MPNPRELAVRLVRVLQHMPSKAHRREVAARTTLPTGHDRVYCYHIRKTAGTSLGMAFLGLTGDAEQLYDDLHKKGRWIESGGRIFVRSDLHLIEEGHYLMGSAHSPAWALRLPPNTFRVTCLRDPVARVLSHYRMNVHFAQTSPERTNYEKEWLGDGFADFLDNIPREHLLRQLYMFSRRMDVGEATDFVSGIEFVMRQETFDDDLARLAETLDLPLSSHRAKKYQNRVEIPDEQVERLRAMMRPEYEFMERLEAAGVLRTPAPAANP